MYICMYVCMYNFKNAPKNRDNYINDLYIFVHIYKYEISYTFISSMCRLKAYSYNSGTPLASTIHYHIPVKKIL